MTEPFQSIKISSTICHVTWHGEVAFWVHKSAVWNNDWKAFSKKPCLHDDQDKTLRLLLPRLKAQCEKAIVV